MPAGMDCKVRAIRWVFPSDDDVGGARPSGTVLHESLDASLTEESADITFLQQGIQAKKAFSGLIWGYQLQIR